jgi:uncharacterized protein (DUF2236 family)
MVWRVGRERVLLAGGPAAVLLQIAHPLVAAGVADHSGFRADPLRRLQATLEATLRITFGDERQAREAAEQVATVHGRVRGRLRRAVGPFPAGTPYDARSPELALWVHATLVATALRVHDRFVSPLSLADRERYYEEVKPFARSFGVEDDVLPADYRAFRTYVARMVAGPQIAVGDDAGDLADQILRPPVALAARPAIPAIHAVTAWLLPPKLREGFGLPWGLRERALVSALGPPVRLAIKGLPAGLRYWPHVRIALERVAKSGNEQVRSRVFH